jgi:type IV pilus assembly protein PilW
MMIRQKGFNIIEMMVGLTIGLFGMLAVTQVFINFNKQRNTTTQTLEAQSNGAMALFLMERDLTQAGYGLLALSSCPNIQWYWNPASCSGTCGLQSALTTAPVLITPGTGAVSDSLQIQYARSDSGSPGAIVTEAQTAYTDHFKLASTAGFDLGDMVVADVVTGGTHRCTMSRITKINDDTAADPNKFTLEHDTATAGLSDYNPGTAPSANGWKPAGINTMLANVGSYISKNYSVISNSLQMSQFPGNTNDIAADGIVFMKAQYGKDNNKDGAVDVWDTAAVTDYKTVIAVRIGVIARSPLLEKDPVVLKDSAGSNITSLTVLPAIDTTAAVTWPIPDMHYRYKTYYTVVPIRNVIWSQ